MFTPRPLISADLITPDFRLRLGELRSALDKVVSSLPDGTSFESLSIAPSVTYLHFSCRLGRGGLLTHWRVDIRDPSQEPE